MVVFIGEYSPHVVHGIFALVITSFGHFIFLKVTDFYKNLLYRNQDSIKNTNSIYNKSCSQNDLLLVEWNNL